MGSPLACTCDRYELVAPDGSVLEGERVRDPECRRHGFPTDEWPAHHPLRRHARTIDVEQRYELQGHEWTDTVRRLETPRETEQRLYLESLPSTTEAA